MKTTILGIVAAAGLVSTAQAQVQMRLLANVDLVNLHSTTTAPQFIGTNPAAVYWNGTDAWIGGYNNSGNSGSVGISRVTNVLTAPSSVNPAFGITTSVSGRGYTSLASTGGVLGASLDPNAAGPNGIRGFDITTGTQLWDGTAGSGNVRGYGVAVDPGYNASGTPGSSGFGFMNIGSGTRRLANPASGAAGSNINVNFATASTTWRDLAYNPNTGDMYFRESNRLGFAQRTGDNSISGTSVLLGGLSTAVGFDNQNLGFINSGAFGNFIILNNRTSGATTQAAITTATPVIRMFSTSGAALTYSLFNTDGVTPLTLTNGNGAYDFSFDAATQTLAVTDFYNKRLYIFQVPTPGAAALLGLGGLVAARRRR